MFDAGLLLSRSLVLFTGKGGIGKTVVAAALGQYAAAKGKRVLIVESAARDQQAPLFGAPDTDHVERRVAPGIECINLNPTDNFREYVVKYLGQKVLYDTVFSHRVVESFINTIPGLPELMLLGRLFYHCQLAPEPRPDLVIFDGFASGHFMSLMTTPDAALQSNLGGPLARETARVKAFMQDEQRCGIVYVAVPEVLVVSEALDFLPRLQERAPAKVLGIALNRLPAHLRPDGLRRDGAGDPAVALGEGGPATAYAAQRVAAAQRAFATLRAGTTLPIWTLPELGFIDEPLPPGFAEAFFQ